MTINGWLLRPMSEWLRQWQLGLLDDINNLRINSLCRLTHRGAHRGRVMSLPKGRLAHIHPPLSHIMSYGGDRKPSSSLLVANRAFHWPNHRRQKKSASVKRVIHWLVWLTLLCVVAAQAAETTTYVLTDDQGTVLAKTDAHGNIIARYDYRPYGAPVSGSLPGGPGYTGHVNDPDLGLVYMQARYYDPIGHMLSVDPIRLAPGNIFKFNRYAYANNNPNRFIDPDGRNVVTALGGVATETWNALNGRGFDGPMVMGALADGYNGEGDGFASAAFQDVTTLVPTGALAGTAIKVSRLTYKAVKVANVARANKIVHIFSQSRHNLAGLAKALGGEGKAFKAIEKATGKAVDTSKAGRFETTVKVGGEQVTVRGSVVDGKVKIGTAFIKEELKR
ncbi:RHS repeat domain-containing protein [Frateuria hangzhouensis]|uniref:RHS repeat domain-containing protein n=1 Tax=Frateuria hangzhouensis TaxID=2995589 RepID=UPI002260BFD5|nr:RHS repeat-associated core domain-containing protein [Frateuria sp. STR12]MCX7514078.1 RHS repeat-associated core domain-containing protein [Frateuria sp. STR12]